MKSRLFFTVIVFLSLTGSSWAYLQETIDYQTRVLADGGVVNNIADVDASIVHAKNNGYWSNVKIWTSPNFGVKADGSNKISKLYNLVGNNDPVQANPTYQPVLVTNGIGGTYYTINMLANTFFSTASMDFTATDKVSVITVAKAFTSSLPHVWAELGTDVNAVTDSFSLFVNTDNKLYAIVKGNIGYAQASTDTVVGTGFFQMYAGIFDKSLASHESTIFTNKVAGTTFSSNSNNTNSFGNRVVYIGSRAGTASYANIQMVDFIVLNTAVSPSTEGLTEDLFGGKYPLMVVNGAYGSANGGTFANLTSTDVNLCSAGTVTAFSNAGLYTWFCNGTNGGTNAAGSAHPYLAYTDSTIPVPQAGFTQVSAFSRLIYNTTATSATVYSFNNIYSTYPQFTQLGVVVNGSYYSTITLAASGNATNVVTLPAGSKTVEFVVGLQSKPAGSIVGTYINNITFNNTATPVSYANSGILFYGDSITVGADSTTPGSQGFAVLQRYLYGLRVAVDGYGYKALNDETATPALESALITRLATYNPSVIWLAVGTNDYGLNKWNAADFGAAYATFLDQLHAAIPSVKIVAQTPIVRVNETANTLGNTTGDYRSQIAAACSSRPWVTLVNGPNILSTSDLDGTGVHPTTAGHAKYAAYVNGILNAVISGSQSVWGLNFGL